MSFIKELKENINKKIKSGKSSRSSSNKSNGSSNAIFIEEFLDETNVIKIQKFLRSKLVIDKNTLDNRVNYLNYIEKKLKDITNNDCLSPKKFKDVDGYTIRNILDLEKRIGLTGTNSEIYKTSVVKTLNKYPIATKVMPITKDNLNEVAIMNIVKDNILIPKRSKHFPIMYKSCLCNTDIPKNLQLISINEIANGDISMLMNDIVTNKELLYNVLFQSFIAIGSFHNLISMVHNDIHGGNLLWHYNNEKGYYHYRFNSTNLYLKASQYNVMIYDYSYATKIKSKRTTLKIVSDYTELIPSFLNESFSNSGNVSPPDDIKNELYQILDLLVKQYNILKTKYNPTSSPISKLEYKQEIFQYIIDNILIPFSPNKMLITNKPKNVINNSPYIIND